MKWLELMKTNETIKKVAKTETLMQKCTISVSIV